MRQEVAAVEIALGEHAGHALNRGEFKIAVAINDANLRAHDLKESGDGVKGRSEVPCSMDQGRIVNFGVLERPLRRAGGR